tara:strand:- start:40 stop:636 length:597 start_codon:yes stop_codon:yes gene_type:complete
MKKPKILEHPKTGVRYLDTCDAVRGSNSPIAQSEDNDCVVRAFASVTKVDYEVAHDYVKRIFKRPPRKGTPRFGPIMEQRQGLYTCGKMKYERMTNHDETTYTKKSREYNWDTYEYEMSTREVTIKSRFWPLITTYGKTRLSKMTVGTFLKEYPKGKYLLHVRSHAFAIVDGVVMGNLADARQMKCRIIDAYKFRQCE